MVYQVMNCWDIVDRIKLINNMILISQKMINPNKVLYDTIYNNLTKNCIRQIIYR